MKTRTRNLFCFALLSSFAFVPLAYIHADDNPSENAEEFRNWLRPSEKRRRQPGEAERNHASVRSAFASVATEANKSTIGVLSDGKPAALGAVVDASGFVLTKHSELKGELKCQLPNGERYAAKIVGIHPDTDLALLKIEAMNLPVLQWSDSSAPVVGSLVATTGLEARPLAIGVASVGPREIDAPSGILGILLGDDEDGQAGPRIDRVIANSGAEKAGLQVNDHVVSVEGKEVPTRAKLIETVKKYKPGEKVRLSILRGDKSLTVTATLGDRAAAMPGGDRRNFQNALGGELSTRRAGFPSVWQHDTVLAPEQCGGPIVDLDGKAVGINIARSGRVSSFALPVSVIKPLIPDFIAGKFSPTIATKKRIEKLTKDIAKLQRSEAELAMKAAATKDLVTGAEKAEAAARKAFEAAQAAFKKAERDADVARQAAKQAQRERDINASELKTIKNEKTSLEDEVKD